MQSHLEPVAALDVPASFPAVTDLVLGFVRHEPGAQQALLDRARVDPEAVTLSLVTLGAVLLDILAGAFDMASDEMLAKVAAGISGLPVGG